MSENDKRTPENADNTQSEPRSLATSSTSDVTTDKPSKDSKKSSDSDKASSNPATTAATSSTTTNEPADGGSPYGSSWTGKAALALSVIAIVGCAYLLWSNEQVEKRNQALQQKLQQTIDERLKQVDDSLTKRVDSLSGSVNQVQSQLKSSLDHVDKVQQQFAESVKKINARSHTTRKDWLLAEDEYLLRVANQRVLMEHSADGALDVLREADKLLAQADDASLYAVRKALAADIAALEAVPKLDREGIYLRLGALNGQVDQLRLIPTLDQAQQQAEDKPHAESTDTDDSWKGKIKQGWHWLGHQFGRMFYVQRRDQPIKPLLTPEQEFYLKQDLHLQLEQAQLALLNREQPVFDAALKQAISDTQNSFDAKDSHTQALLSGLNALTSTQVNPSLPRIDGSLNALKAHLAEQTKSKQEAKP